VKGLHYLLAIFGTFTLGWIGIVMIPESQIGHLTPQVDEEGGDVYPVNISGVLDQGRRVYAAEGCFYCHSQQVRPDHIGPDIERGWGTRQTAARDYIYDRPALLGTMRNGPDLANIGARQKSAQWHYLHLYNPRSLTADSIMPSFHFLFEKRKISGERSPDALSLTGPDAVEDGYEVVPTQDAKALVGYLLALDHSHPLKEVKEVKPASEAPAK